MFFKMKFAISMFGKLENKHMFIFSRESTIQKKGSNNIIMSCKNYTSKRLKILC
jgi:hypothetical protein